MQRTLHLLATRRAAIAVMAAVILTLALFAVWAARSSYTAVDSVQRLTTVSDAFQAARHAVAEENLAARRYQLEPDGIHTQEYDQATNTLNQALDVVQRSGSPGDLQLAADIRRRNDMAGALFATFPGLARRNDISRIFSISDNQLQPQFDAMSATLDQAGRVHHEAALAALAQSRQSQRVVITTTAITIALGMLLLGSASAALRFRERLERVRLREVDRLKQAALADSLTGLGNHRAFEEDLGRELAVAAEEGRELCLALVDLDGLKQINDTHGHQAGDECIRTLAAVLANAGANTSAYRIGGDEFALIVTTRRAMDTLYLLQHLQGQLGEDAGSSALTPSATGGVAEATAKLGRDELIRRADLALIHAKRNHRRCLLYNDSLEPTLSPTDQAAEQRHTDALATALARAVDAKDAYTHSHCETVSELCGLIAQELGMSGRHIARLRLAGLLHDVGKIGITDSILQKPGPLTEEEFEVMKTHTRLGHAIVTAAERPIEATWILHHHERVDGGGYPDGLRGEEIPFESRVILVADAFEAITADRPYRMHQSAAIALDELE